MNATVGQKDYFDWTDALTRAEARLSKMSHEDKVAIALHDYAAVDAEEIIVFDYADGPNGIRGHIGATAFPSALALASTFDRGTATAYGIALAHETLAAGRNAVFSPGLDIVLVPKGGRAGQQLGEDPLLAGEIGGSVGQVIQTQGVLAVATHYVANNFEWLRTGSGSVGRRGDAIDVHVSDRALHEIYLEPFRRALGKYGVAAFMGSYNRLNGEYVCQRHDLLSLPRRLWQWAGVCVPDYLWAVRDAGVALHAGLDLPSLGDAGGRTAEQVAELGEQRLNDLVLHVLTASERVGLAPPSPGSSSAPPGAGESTPARPAAVDSGHGGRDGRRAHARRVGRGLRHRVGRPAVMGALTGVILGPAQALALPARAIHRLTWAVALPALWALGWLSPPWLACVWRSSSRSSASPAP